MSYQEKNIFVSLITFSLILMYFLMRVVQMTQSGSFNPPNVFRLWAIVVVLGIFVTIIATILTHILSAIVQGIQTKAEPVIEEIADERDRSIELRGIKVNYFVSSGGVFLAMLAFVFGQPALVMFTLIIFFVLVAQVLGDLTRLFLYQRGF